MDFYIYSRFLMYFCVSTQQIPTLAASCHYLGPVPWAAWGHAQIADLAKESEMEETPESEVMEVPTVYLEVLGPAFSQALKKLAVNWVFKFKKSSWSHFWIVFII